MTTLHRMSHIDGYAVTPHELIPNSAFRAAIDRLIAEFPAPADSMIADLAEQHIGRMTGGDLHGIISAVRRYAELTLRLREGV